GPTSTNSGSSGSLVAGSNSSGGQSTRPPHRVPRMRPSRSPVREGPMAGPGVRGYGDSSVISTGGRSGALTMSPASSRTSMSASLVDQPVEPLRRLDPLLDHLEDHVLRRSDRVQPPDDLTHREAGQLLALHARDAS